MSEEAGRPLPKFGEWDVNDPASADGFTVIFNKARDEKRVGLDKTLNLLAKTLGLRGWHPMPPRQTQKNGFAV